MPWDRMPLVSTATFELNGLSILIKSTADFLNLNKTEHPTGPIIVRPENVFTCLIDSELFRPFRIGWVSSNSLGPEKTIQYGKISKPSLTIPWTVSNVILI